MLTTDVQPSGAGGAGAVAVAGIDPTPHMEWCRRLAIKVARKGGLLGDSIDEVICEAYATLVRLSKLFDPTRLEYGEPGHLFRGWSRMTLLTVCRRAVSKNLHGGLSGVGEKQIEMVTHLSHHLDAEGMPIEMADRLILLATHAGAWKNRSARRPQPLDPLDPWKRRADW